MLIFNILGLFHNFVMQIYTIIEYNSLYLSNKIISSNETE